MHTLPPSLQGGQPIDPSGGSSDLLASLRACELPDAFWIYQFKVLPCPHGYRHSWTQCPFAHAGETARRRCPKTYVYSPDVCPNAKGKRPCPSGDTCPFAHNTFEQWLHPSRYRTRLCYLGANCRRPTCFFAHTVEELRHVPTDEREGGVQSLGGTGPYSSALSAELASLPAALLAPPPMMSSSNGMSLPLAGLLNMGGAGLPQLANALGGADLFQPQEMLSAPLPTMRVNPSSPNASTGPSSGQGAGQGLGLAALQHNASGLSASAAAAQAALRQRLRSSPALKVGSSSPLLGGDMGPLQHGMQQHGAQQLDMPRHIPLPSNRTIQRRESGPGSGPLTVVHSDGESLSAPLPSTSEISLTGGITASAHLQQQQGLQASPPSQTAGGLIVIGGGAQDGDDQDDDGGMHQFDGSKQMLMQGGYRSMDGPGSGPFSATPRDRASPDIVGQGAGGMFTHPPSGPHSASNSNNMFGMQQQQQQQQQPMGLPQVGGLLHDPAELQALLPLLQSVLSQGLATGQLKLGSDGQLQMKGPNGNS